MNRSNNFRKAIEQAVVMPSVEELRSASDEECDFSDEYTSKMNALAEQTNKHSCSRVKPALRKVIFIVAAALMIGSITLAAVPQLREWFVGSLISAM